MTDSATIRKISDEAFAALNRGAGQVLPFSTRYPAFSMDDAYRVTALVNDMRVAKRYKRSAARSDLPTAECGMNTALKRRSGDMSTIAR